jgi:tetratricopeptide (TPR) repeat protein
MALRQDVSSNRYRTTAAVLFILLATPHTSANPASDALRLRAATDFYNQDNERAALGYRQAIAADPEDAAAYRGLASTLWTTITASRGMLTVDTYLGGASRPNPRFTPPPAELATAFDAAMSRATALSRARVAANAKNTNAQYDLGAAIGLRASYIATVEGGILGAFRAAREAYAAHERVLRMDPARRDAGLIVGTYRYIVSVQPLPLRWAAYVAGLDGGRQKGLQLIQAAAEYRSENQAEARLALVLLYNRERRYDEALTQLATLREQYPRNRLLWLESGATSLRAGRAAEAEGILSEGLTRFAADDRPRTFGEDALWLYKRGTARAGVGRVHEAEQDLEKSVSLEGRRWVRGRARLELGKLALKAGDRPRAITELRAAFELCESDNDGEFSAEAQRLLKMK